MELVDQCIHGAHCKNHCPYGLDTPSLLKTQKAWYDKFYQEHIAEAE